MSWLQTLRAGQNLPHAEPARLLFILYAVERVCDAIADGEGSSLGVNQDDLFDELVKYAG